jgi:hypothetical protein
VHVAPAGERRIFGVLRDDCARECSRVLERAPHDAGLADARPVVGEDPDAERVQLPHRRELLAAAALGDAARRRNVAHGFAARREHGRDDGGVVQRRFGVGHGDDRGESSERGGAGAGFDRLRLFVSRLAEVGVQVDEARHDHAAGGIEHGRAFDAPRHRGHDTALHEHVGHPVAGRVDDAPAFDHELVGTVRQRDLPTRAATTARPSAPRPRWRPAR